MRELHCRLPMGLELFSFNDHAHGAAAFFMCTCYEIRDKMSREVAIGTCHRSSAHAIPSHASLDLIYNLARDGPVVSYSPFSLVLLLAFLPGNNRNEERRIIFFTNQPMM